MEFERELNATTVFVCHLIYDYCVALDSIQQMNELALLNYNFLDQMHFVSSAMALFGCEHMSTMRYNFN